MNQGGSNYSQFLAIRQDTTQRNSVIRQELPFRNKRSKIRILQIDENKLQFFTVTTKECYSFQPLP